MEELHNKQAAEYLAEGEVFDESRKDELLSKMAAGEELTEHEKGLVGIFASAQEIDSATASAKLQTDISEQIFQQMEQSGISPIPSFEVSIGIDGKVKVDGIEDTAVKEKVEGILNGFSVELMDTYVSINASMQGMTKQEQYIVKAAMGIEAFLQKATGGNVALSDIKAPAGCRGSRNEMLSPGKGIPWAWHEQGTDSRRSRPHIIFFLFWMDLATGCLLYQIGNLRQRNDNKTAGMKMPGSFFRGQKTAECGHSGREGLFEL